MTFKFYYEGETALTCYATNGTDIYEYAPFGGARLLPPGFPQEYLNTCTETHFDALGSINNAARLAFADIKAIRSTI